MGTLPKLTQFIAGSMTKSINIHSPDIGPDLQYSKNCINVSQGITQGTGPRHGMAPIPGHSDTEALATFKFPGLMKSEVDWITAEYGRVKVYAIHPITLGGTGAFLGTKLQYYAVVVGLTDTDFPGNLYLDVLLLSFNNSFNPPATGVAEQSQAIDDGLPQPGLYYAKNYPSQGIFTEFLNANFTTTQQQKMEEFSRTTAKNFLGSTPFTVNNASISQAWLVGDAGGMTFPNAATTAPSLDLIPPLALNDPAYGPYNATFFTGLTSDIVYGNFLQTNRSAKVYALKDNGSSDLNYSATFQPSTSIFKPGYTQNTSGLPNIDLSAVTAVKDTAAVTYGTTKFALYNDDAIRINASYQGVLVAGENPYCVIMQDWLRASNGNMSQYVDLVNNPFEPQSIKSSYNEDGTPKSSCFGYWPNYVTNTAMAPGAQGVRLGAANTGILRSNTTYEIAYSIYNKRLNYETNVGSPVRVRTGTDDFIALTIAVLNLGDPARDNQASQIFSPFTISTILPIPGPSNTNITSLPSAQISINHIEYRFYYRQLGAQEWLPGLFIEGPKWWFYPKVSELQMCTGGIGGLPGGRPGGFVDYSRLPADKYTCAVMYKNRAFWFSDKAIVFSLQNSIFAYPANNTAAVPTGSLKGALVQAYYGQANQDARLVIFTTAGTFVGKFSGSPTQIPVQVSTTTVANFDLDGSDFEINPWTSVSAFSYRSAVVAEGILYMWGPAGIFKDDGVSFIARISMPIEPDIFEYFDPALTDDICTLYNDTTKEIYWFYPPKVADGYATHAIVYNTVRESWLFAKFAGSIDHAQQITIKTGGLPTAGTRGVVYTRKSAADTIQRAAYFDKNNYACDIFPSGELMVKSFTTPQAGQRAFTLAAGYDAAKFATIAVGDLIAVSQAAAYAPTLVNGNDFIGTVASAAAGVITVNVPSTVTFDASATFTENRRFMPLWHFTKATTGINGFPYVLDTYYWAPGGLSYWAYWLHVHMMFKVAQLLPAATPLTFNFAFRTPISDYGEIGEDIAILNNSDNNFQVLHPLAVGNQNLEGQALKFTLSGIQGAGGWMIQYLEAYTQFLDGMQLKLFEG